MASIIGVQELQHTNGTTAMTIDSTGFASGLMVNAGRQSLSGINGYEWTGIPSTARKILVVYRLFYTQNASINRSTYLRVGNGSIVTSGYECSSSFVGENTAGSEAVTDGFFSYYWANGTQNQFGQFELTYLDNNSWVCSGKGALTEYGGVAGNATVTHTGYINLSSALDRVKISMLDGTTTYNANSEAVLYYMG